MPLKDLAYTSEDHAEMKSAPMPMDYEGPKYPWGLQLTLDEHCLEKLGVTAQDFEVGQDLNTRVVLKVTSISMNETAEGGKHQSVGLTLTKADLGGGSSDAEKAKKLYGSEAA